MALQLTGAAKTDSLANLQVRLPVVVIGGGLTAIDTATEALAVIRCRWRFLSRYETLVASAGSCGARQLDRAGGGDRVRIPEHAREFRAERERPRARAASRSSSISCANGAARPSSIGGG